MAVFMKSSSANATTNPLLSRSFLSLFSVQFLGAFNDNLFKNALVMLITFRLSESADQTGLLITLAAGLFILPFFIFSALAGQIADHYPKTWLVKKIKLAEVMIMGLGAIALLSSSLELLFLTLFLMGAQSAFFGPIKYAILPEMLDRKRLIQGNSLFSGSTFIAILLGTIGGGLGVLTEQGTTLMAVVIVFVAVIGYLFSLFLQVSATADKTLVISLNIFNSTWQMVRQSADYPLALLSIISISWFWFIGATLLSQIPALVKYDLGANDNVVVAFLTLFSIGIALGSALVSRLMKNRVHLYWHWLMMAAISMLLWLTVWSIDAGSQIESGVSRETLLTMAEMIGLWPQSLSLLFMGLLAVVGGMYIVPLYTLLQTYTPFSVRARMVAVNNIVNSFLMVLSALLLMVGFAASLSLLQMLSILAVFNLLVVGWLFRKRELVTK